MRKRGHQPPADFTQEGIVISVITDNGRSRVHLAVPLGIVETFIQGDPPQLGDRVQFSCEVIGKDLPATDIGLN